MIVDPVLHMDDHQCMQNVKCKYYSSIGLGGHIIWSEERERCVRVREEGTYGGRPIPIRELHRLRRAHDMCPEVHEFRYSRARRVPRRIKRVEMSISCARLQAFHCRSSIESAERASQVIELGGRNLKEAHGSKYPSR